MRTMLILLFLLTACSEPKKSPSNTIVSPQAEAVYEPRIPQKEALHFAEVAYKNGYLTGQLNCRVVGDNETRLRNFRRDSIVFRSFIVGK